MSLRSRRCRPFWRRANGFLPRAMGRLGGGQANRKARRLCGVLWRFLPMLWPKGEAELKARVIAACCWCCRQGGGAAHALRLQGGDRPHVGRRARSASSPAGAGLCRGALRRRARRQSAQRLVREGRPARRGGWPASVFRHIHDLSLRFHLERRTGILTKIVERGTKSIDMMLYFLLFNIAPTPSSWSRSASSSSSSSARAWSRRLW